MAWGLRASDAFVQRGMTSMRESPLTMFGVGELDVLMGFEDSEAEDKLDLCEEKDRQGIRLGLCAPSNRVGGW